MRYMSQSWVSVNGLVATAPDPNGDVMTVQLTPTQTILVNISPQTHINGQMSSPTSRTSIRDVQRVRVQGVLDRTFEEIRQTRAIDTVSSRPAA